MMKIIRKGLLIGTAVVSVSLGSSALACDLELATGPGGTTVQVSAESLTLVGTTPSAAFDNLGGVLLGNPAFEGSGCTRDQIKVALTTRNPTIASAATVPAGAMFALVRPRVAPVTPPPADQPAAVVEQQQPAPQVAAQPPAPVVAPPPSVRRVEVRPLPAQVNLSEVRASLAALRAEDARLRQELAGIPTSQLSPEQLQLLNTLALIPNWEAKLRNLPENGVVQTASLPEEQQEVVQQVVATEGLVESYVGRDWLDLMSILGFLGFLGVIGLAIFVAKTVRSRIKLVEDGVVALGERVTVTENKIVEMDERQFEHSVQKIADGEQRTLLPAEIKRMKDGQRFDYHLMVDGKVASYTGTINNRTASGDALVMVTEIGKSVTAKQLFAELCKRIEAGETVPYLKAA